MSTLRYFRHEFEALLKPGAPAQRIGLPLVAGWWVILIGYALLMLTWGVYLVLVSARPTWMLAMWERDSCEKWIGKRRTERRTIVSERILIDLVTRIEGHARITVHLDDTGRVSDAHFHVTAFRGFERMFEGRPLLVIFVDALAGSGGGALELGSVAADGGAGWNTHAVEPPALLALTRAVHGRIPEAWLLTVPGRNFDIGEGLSPTAEEGVRQATDYISRLIQAKA